SRAGARPAHPRVPSAPAHAAQPRGEKHPRFPVRGFHSHRLRPASRDQGADRGMRMPLPAILGLAYFFSELVLALTRRSSAKTVSKDANSLRVLWFVIIVSIWLSIHAQERWPSAVLPPWFVPVGIVLFAGGTILRWYSII